MIEGIQSNLSPHENLKLRFTNIFLDVTKKLQKVKIWNNSERTLDNQGWDDLFSNKLKELSVIFGYFVEYDPLELEVKYFIKGNPNLKQDKEFNPPFIPYQINDYKETPKSLTKILNESETRFISRLKAPKVFQHLPIQPKSADKFDSYKFEPDKCLNCKVPCEVRSENDYFVVLFDEIAFFQFAYCNLNGNDVFDHYIVKEDNRIIEDNRKTFLKYLLKFAIGVELKLEKNLKTRGKKLWAELKLDENIYDNWNKSDINDENKIRREIENSVENNIGDNVVKNFSDNDWVKSVLVTLNKIVINLINEVKKDEIYHDPQCNDLFILKHIARFDIQASFEVKEKGGKLIMHDVFVFPVYTQKIEPIVTTECIQGEKLDIHSPVLVVLYIKTLFEIQKSNSDSTPQFDETDISLDGFHLTKEIVKVFAEKLIQEDYLKNIVKKELVLPSVRAAISQVMARNTSHNIGAHVMNKLIGDLSQIKINDFNNYKGGIELYKDDNDDDNNNDDENEKDNDDNKSKNKNKNLLDQISIFNNYVKCRMDYLADVSFGTPLMQTNKYVYADLYKELDKVRLLLEHISGLDNFKFEIKFQKNGKDVSDENDLLVAIPNDILGAQAFYNILENIIRNSAKHSDKPELGKDQNFVFTVNFIDDLSKVDGYCNGDQCDKTICDKAHKKEIENILNEFIAVEVFDNIPVDSTEKNIDATVEKIRFTDKEISEYKRMMDNKEPKFKTDIDALVFRQNIKLNEDILQENKLRSYSLGLVEMDASAAYLRKRPVEYINHRSYDIQYDESWSRDTEKNGADKEGLRGTNCRHFLKAFRKTEGDKNYLGYRFFLHRPAVALIVTDLLNDNKEKKNNLRKEGIWLIERQDFEKDLNEGKVYPHEFVVYSSEIKTEIEKIIKDHKTSLPTRTISFSEEDLKTNLCEKEFKDKNVLPVWEEFCWAKWYRGDSDNPKIEVDISSNIDFIDNNDTDNYITAIYLDHLYSQTTETPLEMWEKGKGAKYLEALTSIGQSKLPDFAKLTVDVGDSKDKIKKYLGLLNFDNVVNHNKNVVTHHKIAESVLTEVIVIDERIQNATKDIGKGGREFMSIPFLELYKKMGIIIPGNDLNLSDSSFKNLKSGIEEFISCKIQTVKPSDFLLIHYSILERMYKNDEIKSKLEEWSDRINVVVTSGRGIPNNLSNRVRFVNLSSVITAFIDVRSKYVINYIANSSRKSA